MSSGQLVELLCILAYSVMAIRISFYDTQHQLVRNSDLAIGIGLMGVLVAVRSIVLHDWGPVVGATIGALALFVPFWLISRLGRSQLGTGDVSLAGLLGLFLGSWGLSPLIIGWAVPFALAAIPSALVWLRNGRNSRIAFGPFILLSAPITLLILAIA